MKVYAELGKTRGVVVLVTSSTFRDQPRLDLREHVEDRPGDPDSRFPTKRGVNLHVRHLPVLLAALQAAAADALEAGHLRAEAFTRAGLSVPDTEQREAA